MPRPLLIEDSANARLAPIDPPNDAPFASVADFNPLNRDASEAVQALLGAATGETRRVVAWSGSLAEGLFDRDPMSWLPRPRDAFNRLCDLLAPALEQRGLRILWRPHARHVLADPQTVRSFLADRDGEPFGLALEPAALLEPEMLDAADTHLERAFETLGPICDVALLTNVRRDERGDRLLAAPLDEGLLDPDLLVRLALRRLPPDRPLALLNERLEAQRRLLDAPDRLASD